MPPRERPVNKGLQKVTQNNFLRLLIVSDNYVNTISWIQRKILLKIKKIIDSSKASFYIQQNRYLLKTPTLMKMPWILNDAGIASTLKIDIKEYSHVLTPLFFPN